MTPFESGIAACTVLTSPNALAVSVSASSNFHERERDKTRLIAVSFPSPIQAPTCRELSRGERPCRPPRVGQRCCEAGDGDRRVVDVRDRLRLLGDERLPEKEPGACAANAVQ